MNLALSNVQLSRSFFYFLKEIQYFFLFFYVFYHIKSIDSAKSLLKLWVFLGFITAAWVIFQLISGIYITYYYGPTSFIEPEGTFPGGGFFLIIFIFLLNVFLYYYVNLPMNLLKRIALLIAIASPAIGVLSSGSRSAFFGLVIASLASFLIYATRINLLKAVFIFSLILLYIFLIFAVSPLPAFQSSSVLNRFSNVEEIKVNLDPEKKLSRPEIWLYQLKEMSKEPFSFILGFGKAAVLGQRGVGESHSQYMRNFVETGIFGVIVFAFLLYSILKTSFKEFLRSKDALLTAVSIGFFCSTLAMMAVSLFAEGFLVVKINEVYWFFAAMTFAVISIYSTHKNDEKSIALPK